MSAPDSAWLPPLRPSQLRAQQEKQENANLLLFPPKKKNSLPYISVIIPNPGAWSLTVLCFSRKQPWRETPPRCGGRGRHLELTQSSQGRWPCPEAAWGASPWLGAASRPLSPRGGFPLPLPILEVPRQGGQTREAPARPPSASG